MEAEGILEELLGMLEQNGVSVRRDRMGGGGGGFCKLKNKRIFFVDNDADTMETATACARAIRQIVDVENVYIRPQVREFIEKNASWIDNNGSES